MQKEVKKPNKRWRNLKVLPIAALFMLPLSSFSQTPNRQTTSSESDRVELNYKQRHSKLATNNDLYADGIKIKRDLSILKEIQEERVFDEDEIPASDLYGGVWNNRYVNAYRSLDNLPDTFKVNLSNFTMPTMGHITSEFGPRRRRMHYGIDLKVQVGDTIYATFDGKVRLKQFERRGYGYYVVLRHPNGLETVYGHLSKFLVEEDQVVKSGDPIALGGNTGRSTGSHLHWEFRFLGKPINPKEIVDFENKTCHRDYYVITPNSFDYPTRRGAKKGSATYLANSTRSSKTKGNKYASANASYYKIKSGDTLGRIAQKNGTTVKKLCSMNSITPKTILRPGKSLRVS
ncbi:MAG: peptidoglycan DD-metalloendopeptidase family protein [Dysgonomonas sp.]